MTSTLLGLGFVLGLKHALDADHIAAVATLASNEQRLFRSSLLGIYWGMGHTAALLVAALILLALEIRIPEVVAMFLELAVALMLAGMGANACFKVSKGARVHHHRHRHGLLTHTHPHIHDQPLIHASDQDHHDRADDLSSARRSGRSSFLVGVVHGMAGSAGVMLLLAATIQDFWWGLWYVLSFGIGSIAGMLAISAAVGIPSMLMANRFERAYLALRTFAGVGSLGIGILLGWRTMEGLLAYLGS